jgi:hypothetical protein
MQGPLIHRLTRLATASVRWVVIVVLFIAAGAVSPAHAAAPTEDQVKAAFLLNFPKYVEWPHDTFHDEHAPIVLAVVGDRRLEEEIRRMAVGKLYDGRRVEVRGSVSVDDVGSDCRIVFVGATERRRADEFIGRSRGGALLTVGEWEEFLAAGGMINLARHDRKIRLEINLPAVEEAGLKISSKMLSVAEIVRR